MLNLRQKKTHTDSRNFSTTEDIKSNYIISGFHSDNPSGNLTIMCSDVLNKENLETKVQLLRTFEIFLFTKSDPRCEKVYDRLTGILLLKR